MAYHRLLRRETLIIEDSTSSAARWPQVLLTLLVHCELRLSQGQSGSILPFLTSNKGRPQTRQRLKTELEKVMVIHPKSLSNFGSY